MNVYVATNKVTGEAYGGRRKVYTRRADANVVAHSLSKEHPGRIIEIREYRLGVGGYNVVETWCNGVFSHADNRKVAQ